MKPLFIFLLVSISFLEGTFPEEKPVNNEPLSIFQYLHQDSLLKLTIKVDLKKLNRYEKEPQPHSAILEIDNIQIPHRQWKIKLEQRGKLRRKICDYKPLKISFPKKELQKNQLNASSFKSLKLVSSCMGGELGEALVLKEYLAYRLYNMLTEKSHEVQLVRTSFEDSLGRRNYSSYGFLLEPVREMAYRNHSSRVERKDITPEKLIERDYLLMSIFEYFIANTDWKLEIEHNVEFLLPAGESFLLPVAYDFDFSGLVGARYASPNQGLPIKTTRERLFMGSYKDNMLRDEVLQLFRDKKDDMKKLVLDFHYLSLKERQRSWKFLESFFKSIEKSHTVRKIFPKQTDYQDQMILDLVEKKN